MRDRHIYTTERSIMVNETSDELMLYIFDKDSRFLMADISHELLGIFVEVFGKVDTIKRKDGV